jgi:hypothetical protein
VAPLIPVTTIVAVLVALLPIVATAGADWPLSAEQRLRVQAGEIIVESGMASGRDANGYVRAAVLIHAPRAQVFGAMTDCAQVLRFVPGLVQCVVLETGPDVQWQVFEQTLDLSWFLPRTHHVFRADYVRDENVCFHALRGDFRVNEGCWALESLGTAGAATLVTYRVRLETRFYVPRWLLRQGLRRNLPEMLRAMRAYCEVHADARPDANPGANPGAH